MDGSVQYWWWFFLGKAFKKASEMLVNGLPDGGLKLLYKIYRVYESYEKCLFAEYVKGFFARQERSLPPQIHLTKAHSYDFSHRVCTHTHTTHIHSKHSHTHYTHSINTLSEHIQHPHYSTNSIHTAHTHRTHQHKPRYSTKHVCYAVCAVLCVMCGD